MKKTSQQWSREVAYEVRDPDGWDRNNFEYSWYKEKITKKEFETRAMSSTLIMYPTDEKPDN